MRKSTKIMATLGVVSGLGISVLPISNLFATPFPPTPATSDDTANVSFTTTVNAANAISLLNPDDSTQTTVSINVTPDSPTAATGITKLLTSSNVTGGYQVTVASTSTTAQLVNSTNPGTPIPSSANIGADGSGNVRNAWAIKTAVTGYTDTWQAIPSSSATALPVVVTNAPSALAGDTNNVTWGITVNSSILSGVYTDTVQFTIGLKS